MSPPTAFLWVNEDSKTYKPVRSRPEVRFSINSHIQRQRNRSEASRQAINVRDSAARLLVGWTKRPSSQNGASGKGAALTATVDYERADQDEVSVKHSRTTARPLATQRPSGPLIRSIVTKDSAVDPFSCSATPLTATTFDLMHFYLGWGRPIAARRAAYGLIGNDMDNQVVGLVKSSMFNKLRGHAVLYQAAAIMEQVAVRDEWWVTGLMHYEQALRTLREALREVGTVQTELIYDMCLLCRAARARQDFDAARIHLQAVKEIVDLAGGVEEIDFLTMKYAIYSDRRLAYGTLVAPLFSIDEQLITVGRPPPAWFVQQGLADAPPEPWQSNELLEAHSDRVLKGFKSGSTLPENLQKLIGDVLLCGRALESGWGNRKCAANIQWLSLKHISTSTQLLAGSYTAPSAHTTTSRASAGHLQSLQQSAHRWHEIESMRWTLLLWDMLLMSATAQGRARNVLQEIGGEVLEARRPIWPAHVYDGFCEWNAILQSTPLQVAANDGRLFARLISVVKHMERYNEVQLGEFLQCLYVLGQEHHAGRARGAGKAAT